MPKPSKDIIYEMAVSHLRHFGEHATKLRHLALIQSYTVIAGTVYLLTNGHYFYAMLAGVFGGIIMFVLFAIHQNFLGYYKDIQEYILRLESDPEFSDGLIKCVEIKRNERINSFMGWFAINGVFITFSIIMFLMSIYAFVLLQMELDKCSV